MMSFADLRQIKDYATAHKPEWVVTLTREEVLELVQLAETNSRIRSWFRSPREHKSEIHPREQRNPSASKLYINR